ncbi:hypothetical protein O1611_g1886 [Lasiodiplodia mahajangana]|uniref:Uncharacterized protein n=1 Tax=Lasiodiplodia mahajangana TaxID=1108764 RepID=A0ACC2JW35_9PEZI|nr:hypothetical protein O1611_g1886 [Lasiodiplodia mahajangana]
MATLVERDLEFWPESPSTPPEMSAIFAALVGGASMLQDTYYVSRNMMLGPAAGSGRSTRAMGYTFADIIADPGLGPIAVVSIITIPLTLVATVLRLVATKRSGRRLAWDDLFAVLALVGFLGYTITPIGAIPGAADLTEEEASVLTAKLAYIATPFFYVNQLFAKASLLVLYYRIFWSDNVLVRWIYALAVIHFAWFITFFFLVLFLCNPVSKWWDVTGTQPGTCIDGNAFLVSEETINSSIDLAMVGLTVAMVLKLHTRELIKRKLAFIFTLGGLSGIIGFFKIGIIYNIPNDNGQENNANAFWDILQMATSIFCACAPMYKTIAPVRGAWARLKWSTTSWSNQSLLVSSHERLSESSKDWRPSNPNKDDSGRNMGTSWGGLVRYSKVATADSDVELMEVQIPFSERPRHTRNISGQFKKGNMIYGTNSSKSGEL